MNSIPLMSWLAAAAVLPSIAMAQHGPCSLLTAADVEAAAGGAPVRHVLTEPGRIGIGHAAGKPIRLCSWSVGAPLSEVHVTLVAGLDGQAQSEVVTILSGEMNRLHRSGWHEDTQDSDGIHCSVLVQPKATRPPKISTCLGPAKNAVLLVDLRSPTRVLTLDEARKLFDQAAARVVPTP